MSATAVTRITHGCHPIEICDRTFLTDPWFSTKPGNYQCEPIVADIVSAPSDPPDSAGS
jgi:L-ascorbate metabolism protein UlaG (beta-lactamase superfamily)